MTIELQPPNHFYVNNSEMIGWEDMMTAVLLFPLRLLTWVVKLTGRFLAILIGLLFVVLGGILIATGIGAILGLPLVVVGAALMLRGLF